MININCSQILFPKFGNLIFNPIFVIRFFKLHMNKLAKIILIGGFLVITAVSACRAPEKCPAYGHVNKNGQTDLASK